MKERILKIGVMVFLVAVLVAAGVYPLTSSQAAAKTTYNVVLEKDSNGTQLLSINDGAAAARSVKPEYSFKMVVEEKAKTEKVKSTGGTASYYPVTILAKSFTSPTGETPIVGGGIAVIKSIMKKDCKGKLYLSGGDVDVSQVMAEKKTTTKIGDGKADPTGSLIIPMTYLTETRYKDSGKLFLTMPVSIIATTGKNYLVVKGAKGGLEGKALPDSDTLKLLPNPLVGVPLDLDKGTGTLVTTGGTMNVKNKAMGSIDFITGGIFVMKITK